MSVNSNTLLIKKGVMMSHVFKHILKLLMMLTF